MSNLKKGFIFIIIMSGAFAAGRYTAPVKTIEVTKTVEVEKKTKESQSSKDKHKVTTIHQIEHKDGTKETITIIDENSETKRKSDSSDTTNTETDSSKVAEGRKDLVNISALAGLQTFSKPVYGASVSKPILGPVSLGVWGLTNSTLGVSLGLSI